MYHLSLLHGQYLILTEKRIIKIEPGKLEAVEGRYVTCLNHPKKGKSSDLIDANFQISSK